MTTFPLIPVDAAPTAQEVFDACAKWLLAQQDRCMTEEFVDEDGDTIAAHCAYRSPDGLNACAVGCFMPDDVARAIDAEGEKSLSDVMFYHSAITPEWFSEHQDLLEGLQSIHDSLYIGERRSSLIRLASKRGLQFGEDG